MKFKYLIITADDRVSGTNSEEIAKKHIFAGWSTVLDVEANKELSWAFTREAEQMVTKREIEEEK